MKAMKKVLFLMLVLAMALTTVAFADGETSTPISLTEAQVVEMLEGKLQCPFCKTGTVNLHYSVQEWSCTEPFQVTVKCKAEGCALAKQGSITVAIGPLEHKATTVISDYSTATCATPGIAIEETYCVRCGKTLETVELKSALVEHNLLDDAANFVFKNNYPNSTSKLEAAWENDSVYGPTKRNEVAKAVVDRFNKVKADVLGDVDSTYAKQYTYDAKHVTVELKLATCTEDGYIKATCDVCNKTVTKTIEKLGHNLAGRLDIPATCETDGAMARFCTRCDHYEVEVTDSRLGHTHYNPTELYVQNGKTYQTKDELVLCQPYDVEFTCDRYLVPVKVTCDLDDANVDLTAEEILAIAQKIIGDKAELVYVDDVLVYMCRHTSIKEKNVVDFSHDDEDFMTNRAKSIIIYENAKTCEDAYELKVMCKECNYVATKTEDALGHNWDNRGEVIKAATCTEKGVSKVKCLRCNETTEIETPAAGHKTVWYYDPAPSCTAAGVKVTKCTVCNEIVSSAKVDPKHTVGNEYFAENCTQVNGEWVANTCEVDGTLKYTCEVCKQPITETIKAPKHVFDFENIYDPDNTLYGENKNQTPWWVKEIVEATCQNDGTITVWCKNDCGKTSTKLVQEKYAHFTEFVPVKTYIESTCTTAGKGVIKCAWCDRQTDADLPLADHTLLLQGDNTLKCANCDYTEKFDFEVEYTVNLVNAKITSTSTSGVGHIEVIEGKHKDRPLYARINFGYTLDNGEPVAYVACVEIDKHGDFRMASPSCPFGATLTNIAVVITTAGDAQDLVIADVPNLGMTIVR